MGFLVCLFCFLPCVVDLGTEMVDGSVHKGLCISQGTFSVGKRCVCMCELFVCPRYSLTPKDRAAKTGQMKEVLL